MSYQSISLEVEGPIARLTLKRPARLNALTASMLGEISDALCSPDVTTARVLILTGAGRAFCSGQDLSERVPPVGSPPVDLGASIENLYKPVVLALRSLPLPVIAAVNGSAAGSGANLALCCDLVIAARSASFVQPFTRLGLMPDCGGTWILPRVVGSARAMALALLGESVSAEQAMEWGMIWRCIEDAELDSTATQTATTLAAFPPQALAATKRAIQASVANTFQTQLDLERDAQRVLGNSKEYAEAVSAFLAGRPSRSREK